MTLLTMKAVLYITALRIGRRQDAVQSGQLQSYLTPCSIELNFIIHCNI